MSRALLLVLLALATACASARADVYANITAGLPRAVPVDYFGMHIHRLVIGPQDRGLRTDWPNVPLGALRLWDARVRWADLEPQPGTWRFDRLDAYVEAARTHGVTVRYVLGSTPRWASARPDEPCSYGLGCSAEPARLSDWEGYVRAVVRRYKGRIANYELWNEPKFSDIPRDRGAHAFFTGSVADMVAMARIARKVLNAEDPQAKLLTPGFVNGPDRLALFLQAGGKTYVDGIAYHFYASDARQFAEQVRDVREVMRTEGVAYLPLYNTEVGIEAEYDGQPLPQGFRQRTPEQAAGHVAQFMVLGAAVGLASYDFYAWDSVYFGAIDARGAPRPVYEALTHVVTWLRGATFEGCGDRGGWVACRGRAKGVPFLIAWSDTNARVRIVPPMGYGPDDAQRALDGARIKAQGDGSLDAQLDSVPTLFRFKPVAPDSP